MKNNTLKGVEVQNFFKPFQLFDENSTLSGADTCDVKDIPLQKWVNICTVLNGKTCDIYIDGKLVKTCVYTNYYKVDINATLQYLQGGGGTTGFAGKFGRLQVFNSSLTPDNIYQNYLAGPTGSSTTSDPIAFIKKIFTG